MLLDEGKIKSLNERVCVYVSQWCAGEKARVTLRHLLTMTSGLPRVYAEGVGSVTNKDSFVTARPLAATPGTRWAYSNEGVQLLSPILDRAAGEPIQDYAQGHLFEQLGMRQTRLHLDERGHAWTYADMETTPRDFARLGVLMLNRGIWEGQRVVSEAWVDRSTEPSQEFNRQYGLLWWLIEAPRGYAARGYLDTNLYVFPAQELVVVRMQSKLVPGSIAYEPTALQLFGELVHP
jgi:CubicO group peptidase (beta-lactamase class C family)